MLTYSIMGLQDAGSETEDIDHAIALSLLEEDHKRINVVGE